MSRVRPRVARHRPPARVGSTTLFWFIGCLAAAMLGSSATSPAEAQEMVTVSPDGATGEPDAPGPAALPEPEGSGDRRPDRADPETLRRVVAEKQEQTLAMLKDWLAQPVETGERA